MERAFQERAPLLAALPETRASWEPSEGRSLRVETIINQGGLKPRENSFVFAMGQENIVLFLRVANGK